MSSAGFVHLHVHSAYSLLKGSIKIAKLGELAKADRQPALALTDTDNMFGALEFSDKMAGYGIQPIVGCELAVDFGDQDPNARNALASAPSRIVLLAARERGYRSLMRLNSRAFLETPVHQSPHIKLEWLEGDAEDLIALTGGPDGPISLALHADHAALAAARCDRLANLFGDRLYVELQRHGIDKERRAESGLIDLAYAKGLPLVATNEPYFAANDDYEAHDALLCIAGGKLIAETDREQLTPDHRFKTRAEMAVLFADIPEALASTVEIAERCSFRPKTRKPILPRFTVGAGSGSDAVSRGGRGAEAPGRGGARKASAGSRPVARHHGRGLPEASRLRDRRDQPHELCGLLPDRLRLHQMGQGPRHSGRSRPRLRRRFAGRLFADHHRSRSDPLRPAVRALPQSRARVDAGLRHRLLPGPPRRGDRLRAAALRPRSGGADHHLRYAAGARRAARRRPRAADALWPGRQADKTGAAKSGRAGDAGAGDRERTEAAGVPRRGPGGRARLRHRPAPRRADAPRLDPRRRHRDRRPAR